MMASRAALRYKQKSAVLNNKHMTMVLLVKPQLMQAGRCERANRA